MIIIIYISEVTPSQEVSDKGKNKTSGLNYAGPGLTGSDWELTGHNQFDVSDPLLLQPEVSRSSDSPSTLYIVALILYLFLH